MSQKTGATIQQLCWYFTFLYNQPEHTNKKSHDQWLFFILLFKMVIAAALIRLSYQEHGSGLHLITDVWYVRQWSPQS